MLSFLLITESRDFQKYSTNFLVSVTVTKTNLLKVDIKVSKLIAATVRVYERVKEWFLRFSYSFIVGSLMVGWLVFMAYQPLLVI